MKRYISLVLIAAVLIVGLAVPSHASGIGLESNNSWIDVMDFTDLGQVYTTDGYNYVDVALPLNKVYYGIDFVVYDATKINSVYFNHPYQGLLEFTKYDLGSGYYRFYLQLTWTGDSIPLVFDISNRLSQWFQFLSFNVHYSSVDFIPATGIASGYLPDDSTFEISSTGNQAVFFGYDDFAHTRFDFELFCNDWQKFDYLDFSLEISAGTINSISASLDGLSLPFTHTLVQSGHAENTWVLQIRLDLRGLNRSSSATPHVSINGHASTYEPSDISYIALNHCTGILLLNDIDPFFIYFRDLGIKISSGFSSVIAKINSTTDSIISSITSVGTKVETWGQNIVDVIVGDASDDTTVSDAIAEQEKVNSDINFQLQSAVGSWNDNVGDVTQGFNLALSNASPALIWLSGLAQNVFSGMGWFGNMFFFLGFLHVFFLLMSKSGLGRALDRSDKRGDD